MKTADVAALVFELQRTRSPVERAKVLARAWRTIRGLSASERRLLARDVGFDGAEELLEGLAGKGGGGIAPAALLEALGRMRKDDGLSVRGLVSALRDPDQREELVARAAHLVADSLRPNDGPEDEPFDLLDEVAAPVIPTPLRPPEPSTRAPEAPLGPAPEAKTPVEGVASEAPQVPVKVKVRAKPATPPPAVPKRPTEPPVAPKPVPPPEEKANATAAPSAWDGMWASSPGAPVVSIPLSEATRAARSEVSAVDRAEDRRPASVLIRLRDLRSQVDNLRDAGVEEIQGALDAFPEPWARRKGLVALIENGVPEDASVALDLIEALDRPTDRGWCLSTLACRGDLVGRDLERGLAMLTSPAARRRVAALAEKGVECRS